MDIEQAKIVLLGLVSLLLYPPLVLLKELTMPRPILLLGLLLRLEWICNTPNDSWSEYEITRSAQNPSVALPCQLEPGERADYCYM